MPRLRLRVIEANSERREPALQLDGTVLGTLSGIEFGFDSPIDFEGKPAFRRFVGTKRHVDGCPAKQVRLTGARDFTSSVLSLEGDRRRIDRACHHIAPEGNDDIEGGFCWPRRLPMANDGNTVMAIYVPSPDPARRFGHAAKRHSAFKNTLASKVARFGKSHMGAEFAGVKPNRAFVCNGMTKPPSAPNRFLGLGGGDVSTNVSRTRRQRIAADGCVPGLSCYRR